MHTSFSRRVPTRLVLAWLAALVVVPSHVAHAGSQEPDTVRRVPRPDLNRARLLLQRRLVAVPSVIGLHVDSARQLLTNTRLTVGNIRSTGSNEPPGTVLEQIPAADSVVLVGTEVTLVIAVAQGVQLHRLEPAEALPGSGLRIRVYGSGFNRYSQIAIGDGVRTEPTEFLSTRELIVGVFVAPNAAPGPRTVIHRYAMAAVAPPPPVMLEGGFRVLPAPTQGIRVPPLNGYTVPQAIESLGVEGLRPGEIAEVPSDAPRETVVRQDPPPRTIVEPSSVVHLWISMGPEEPGGPPDLTLIEPTVEYSEDSRDTRISVRVLNAGESEAGPTTVRAGSATSRLEWQGEHRIAALAAGGSTSVAFTVPFRDLVAVRTARIRITIDPENRVPEASETNNAVMVDVQARGMPQPTGRDEFPWRTALLAAVGVAAAGGLVWALRALRAARAAARTTLAHAPRPKMDPDYLTPTPAAPDGGGSEEAGAGAASTMMMKGEAEPVRFTAYHPQEVYPDEWNTLLVYVHVPSAAGVIAEDSAARLAHERPEYGQRSGAASRIIVRGADIVVVPELPGFSFNPERKRFQWLEDWHCTDFRMLAASEQPGLELGMPVMGRVAFYVGPILIGEVGIWTVLAETPSVRPVPEQRPVSADPFRAIFPSYSHKDAAIVAGLKKAYDAIGDAFLQDIDVLRSGELWNDKLLEKIDEADVFQLYWSEEALRSTYVEQEWRHALAREIPNFIRPLFWQQPLAEVPSELVDLHFKFVELDEAGPS